MYKFKVFLRRTAMLLISIGLIACGVFVFQHQSSAAFEFGSGLILLSLIHPIFWPDVKKPEDD